MCYNFYVFFRQPTGQILGKKRTWKNWLHRFESDRYRPAFNQITHEGPQRAYRKHLKCIKIKNVKQLKRSSAIK